MGTYGTGFVGNFSIIRPFHLDEADPNIDASPGMMVYISDSGDYR